MEETVALRERLIRENVDYQRLAHKHDQYDRRLVELRSQKYLTDAEQLEEVRLKKLKLAVKDQMEAIVRSSDA